MKTLKTAFEGKKALITYISAGDPDIGTTAYLLQLLDREGVDILEVGIPFSDPLADGPVIQQAGQRALAGGATLKKILGMLAGLRGAISAPIALMGYMNPIIAYGPEKFAADAADAGAAGVIIPDLPFHQSEPLASRAEFDARCREFEERFRGQDVPLPPHWGGYRVIPESVEFWQGRPNRLHDRFVYRKSDGGWRIVRLNP